MNYKPYHLLLITLVSIFTIEGAIMLLILPNLTYTNKYFEAFLDSLLISGLIFPVLHYMLFRPLLKQTAEQKFSEEELKKANERLLAVISELEDRNRENNILREMDDLLQSSRTFEEAYKVINSSAQQLFPDKSGSICLLAASRNYSEEVSVWGVKKSSCTHEACNPDDCWALRRGQPHLVNDSNSVRCTHISGSEKCNYMCVPLSAKSEALGVFYLESPESIDWRVEELAIRISRHISLAISNLRLNEKLHIQSVQDPLTGLYNRRHMAVSLERELHRAARKKNQLGVMMLDIDYFKRFNDTFGHHAGDVILKELGIFFKKHLRKDDIACRYGGEEFTIILPEASLESSMQKAQWLLEQIKHLIVEHHGRSLGSITLSIGVAAFPENGRSCEELLAAADKALYIAKKQGRDRVITAKDKNSSEIGKKVIGLNF
ncbi:MAG: sensor domain-containing diguanylate cyclase [Deltaproteobacteria bacterium]|nr:sensor domain-containing diguanylate cyclase [Deltaproteobacteria bacterium]